MGNPSVMGGLPDDVLRAHLAWLEQRGQQPSSIHARKLMLARLASAVPVPLLDATAADLLAWRAGLRVTGNTAVSYVSHAADFYRWAVRAGLVEENPAAHLPVPQYTRGLPRPVGEQDAMRAVTSAPRRIRPWLVLAGWAGLRAKEIALLRRERVLDTARPPVILVASDSTKGHRERVVAASVFVIGELRAAGMPKSGWLFTRCDGRAGPNSPAVVSHMAAEYLDSIGVDATLHQFRHRFASQLYQATRDLRLVQELLGHVSPVSTAGYAAYDRRGALDAVNAIPAPARLAAVESG